MPTFDCDVLVDGVSGEPVRDARVVVSEGEITAAGPREAVDPGDGPRHEHRVLTPGLIDAHVHLLGLRTMDPVQWTMADPTAAAARATADLRTLLSRGFTAVRDVGSRVGLGLRAAVEEGEIPGPRVYTSGRSISQTAGHGDSHFLPYEWATDEHRGSISTLADGPAECRKEARKRIRDGVDHLKIMTTGGVLSQKDAPDQSQFTDEEIRAFTGEAERAGIPVASHAQGAPGIKAALRNGVDTIEHGFYIDGECLELFEETGATFVPTLAIMHRLVTEGDEHGVPEWGLRKAREAREAHFEAVERAYDAGIPIALGTDFAGPALVPHGENALEAELFVEEVGMSEMDALRAGTGVAARALGDDSIGAVEAGRRGDLLGFAANPLEDVTALYDPDAVYRDGERIDV